MIVETYPIALKKFMKFTKTKSVTLAERIGYDVSYISKWINGAKLPSSRAIIAAIFLFPTRQKT